MDSSRAHFATDPSNDDCIKFVCNFDSKGCRARIPVSKPSKSFIALYLMGSLEVGQELDGCWDKQLKQFNERKGKRMTKLITGYNIYCSPRIYTEKVVLIDRFCFPSVERTSVLKLGDMLPEWTLYLHVPPQSRRRRSGMSVLREPPAPLFLIFGPALGSYI